jgi:hypothetical protein
VRLVCACAPAIAKVSDAAQQEASRDASFTRVPPFYLHNIGLYQW